MHLAKIPLTLATLPQHMVLVEGGEFEMGGESWLDNAKPVHKVNIRSFYLCRFLVTQALWQEVMTPNMGKLQGMQMPVEYASWELCQGFIRHLNKKTGYLYRLPTEAEWEFAARGGRYGRGGLYPGGESLDELGWYSENSFIQNQPIGRKRPNELGIYDMGGSMWEWCQDIWHISYEGAPADGSAWEEETDRPDRVSRGGSTSDSPIFCRAACRIRCSPNDRYLNIGFRLARSFDAVSC